ncbi:MAG TPA: caspase family protein [Candidatus Elarobacter sp.]|jgi:tetratricopeptide (TPR) repeat protein|nr:caspase family protein [Candidatus Elarobacter sp.]
MVRPQRTVAVLVGVERYGEHDTWDLRGPVNDVLRMAQYLKRCNVPTANVTAYVAPLEPQSAAMAELGTLCAQLRKPTQADLNALILGEFQTLECDLLFLYWSGHGVITTKKERLLFTSDAEPGDLRNVDLDSVLERLRTDACPNIDRVDAVVDTCADYITIGEAGVTRTKYAVGIGVKRDQFLLCAASPGEYALNTRENRAGLFSDELMQSLMADGARPPFPPDWSAVNRALVARFKALRRQGDTDQAPSITSETPNETYETPWTAGNDRDAFFRSLGVFYRPKAARDDALRVADDAGPVSFSFGACAEVNRALRTRDLRQRLNDLLADGVLAQRVDDPRLRYEFKDGSGLAAAERLQLFPEAEHCRERHARYYLDFVEMHERRLMSPARRASLREIAEEIPHIEAALDWCVRTPGMAERALRIGAGLFWFWNFSALFPLGSACMHTLLERCADAPRDAPLAKAMYAAGGLAFLGGDFREADDKLTESVHIWTSLPSSVTRDRWLGYALVILGRAKTDFEEGSRLERRAIELFAARNDVWGHALAMNDLGYALMSKATKGDQDAAYDAYAESLSLWSRLGEPWGRPLTLNNLGHLMTIRKELGQARKAHDEALRTHLTEGDEWGVAESLKYLAEVALLGNEPDEAYSCYTESLSKHRKVGRQQLVADCLIGLATLIVTAARPLTADRLTEAVRMLAVAAKARDEGKFVETNEQIARRVNVETTLQNQLGAQRYDDIVREAKKLAPDEVIPAERPQWS